MAIDSVITGNDASHAYDLSEERPGALVYRVRMENNETAVAKVPANFFRHAREVRWKLQDTLLCPLRKRWAERAALWES